MKRMIAVLSSALTGLVCLGLIALAAPSGVIKSTVEVCDPNSPTHCVAPDGSGNMPISGSITATNPSVGTTGAAAPASATEIGAKSSGNLVPLASTDGASLDVNCVTGCAGGATSNATSGAATSANNGKSVSWLYGFNGATWDQLQVDGSKFLKVILQTGANVIGAVTQSGTWTVTGAGGTFPVTAASGSIASGAVASGAVASGAYASGSISDGADVTQGAKADARSTATDATAISEMQVLKQLSFMLQNPAALAAGSNVIGHVIADTGSTTAVTQATGSNLHAVLDSGTLTTLTTLTGTTTLTPGSGATNLGKVEDGPQADGDTGVAALAVQQAAPADTAGTSGDYASPQMSGGFLWTSARPTVSTITASITRPADTAAYAANDAFANSTTVPTAGGFTFTSACRASGGYGTITDAALSMSASSTFQGEIWVFDQAVTATNDNAALSVSDSDVLNLVGVIPFNTNDVNAANAISFVTGLNIGYTCSGTANLRFLVKVMTAFTPASAEVLSVRIKVSN